MVNNQHLCRATARRHLHLCAVTAALICAATIVGVYIDVDLGFAAALLAFLGGGTLLIRHSCRMLHAQAESTNVFAELPDFDGRDPLADLAQPRSSAA